MELLTVQQKAQQMVRLMEPQREWQMGLMKVWLWERKRGIQMASQTVCQMELLTAWRWGRQMELQMELQMVQQTLWQTVLKCRL